MTLGQALEKIEKPDMHWHSRAQAALGEIAKPLGSLGLLEEAFVRIAAIAETDKPRIDKRCAVVFCADNGVVRQGVTQCGQEVTAQVTENLGAGKTAVCIMAKQAGVDVLPVDIGVASKIGSPNVLPRKIRSGTGDIAVEPAMTREEAIKALETGIEIACRLKNEGYHLLATGEMGIGNTTTSAAAASVLLGKAPCEVTGRGAGLSSEGLKRKVNAIERALALHKPDKTDIIGLLSAVGGLDIAGMAGLCIGAAACKMPVVLDGVISCAAALLAACLHEEVKAYLIASHLSGEPAGQMLLDALALRPLIQAEMRLGEGTGAVAAISLLDMMFAVFYEMPRFDQTDIEAYTPQI